MDKRYADTHTSKPIKSNYVSFEQMNFNNKTQNKQTNERTRHINNKMNKTLGASERMHVCK